MPKENSAKNPPKAEEFRAGFVAICGRPNVGKSSLMNAFLREHLAIATAKPQTTRNRIRGILNTEKVQMIFVDTPGFLTQGRPRRQKAFQDYLGEEALGSLEGADALLFVLDAAKGLTPQDQVIWEKLQTELKAHNAANLPVFVCLNKVDILKDKTILLHVLKKISEQLGTNELFPCSAKSRLGVDDIVAAAGKILPVSPALYPQDVLSDQNDRFLVGEVIREKIFQSMGDELPYSSAVQVDSFKEEPEIIRVKAHIFVERESQKGMVIGQGGRMLKRLGSEARQDLERYFGTKVFLEIRVKVLKNWSNDEEKLKHLGYNVAKKSEARLS